MNEGLQAVAEHKQEKRTRGPNMEKKMNETEEAKERRLVDRMASVLRFGKTREEVFEHKHCGYCKKPIRVEYNKSYCDDHCRRTDAMRSWILLALFLGACAAGWALVAIAAIGEHVPA